jgi:hypothetical protein
MYGFLADIHIGCNIKNEDIINSLDFYFDIIRKHNEPCHQIFVCGDLFDHKLNTEELIFAAKVILKIVCNECGDNGNHVPVTFIHGTYSHDQEQYKIFIPLIEEMVGVHIRYLETCGTFTLHNGTKVLCIPQEYGDVDYTQAFNDKYDIIIGHGPMVSNTKTPCPVGSSEICMSADQLGDISNVCVFGHFHEYVNFGKNVFYAGTNLRWKFGEPGEKVFLICDDKWNVTTIKNPYAMTFTKKEIFSLDELRSEISKEITQPVRFIIHCKENELEEYHSILNVYKKNKMISCKFMSERDEQREKVSMTNIMVSNVEPIPALVAYIKDKYDVDSQAMIDTYVQKINKG